MLLGVENVPAWAATRLENRICDFSPTTSKCDVVCPADPESHPDNAVCRQAGTIRYAYDRNRKADRFSGRGGILESVDNKTVLGNPIPAHAEASAPEVRWVLQQRYAYDATEVAMYRFYDPNLQRWLNRDPIQEFGGFNLYEFVNNKPTDGYDSLGLVYSPLLCAHAKEQAEAASELALKEPSLLNSLKAQAAWAYAQSVCMPPPPPPTKPIIPVLPPTCPNSPPWGLPPGPPPQQQKNCVWTFVVGVGGTILFWECLNHLRVMISDS